MKSKFFTYLTPAMIVSALGYFVDTFDIVIFSIVRVSSLTELGLAPDAVTTTGIFLLNMQLIGMLIGGMLWGFLGDRRGRSSALFFSILCYSLANIANGFVNTVESYAICRFISGIGLAGELGAAITLIMEGLPQRKRGLGALFIIFLGSLGAVTAASFGSLLYWRHLYFLGGAMGLVLLLARSKVRESEMFTRTRAVDVSRGNPLQFFRTWESSRQFLSCVMIGVPHYLFFAVMITLSPELAKSMGIEGVISIPILLTSYTICLSFGDLSATLLSQYLRSRKKAVAAFLFCAAMTFSVLMFSSVSSLSIFYLLFGLIGFFAGFCLMIPIIAAESFGTNLRVTASSVATNSVRASAIVLSSAVIHLKYLGLVTAIQIVGGCVMILALLAVFMLRETFHKDMDFLS